MGLALLIVSASALKGTTLKYLEKLVVAKKEIIRNPSNFLPFCFLTQKQ